MKVIFEERTERYICPKCKKTVCASKASWQWFRERGRYKFCDYCGEELED